MTREQRESMLELGALAALLVLHLWLRNRFESYEMMTLVVSFGFLLAGYTVFKSELRFCGAFLCMLGIATSFRAIWILSEPWLSVLLVGCVLCLIWYLALFNKPRFQLIYAGMYLCTAVLAGAGFWFYPEFGERAYLFLLFAAVPIVLTAAAIR